MILSRVCRVVGGLTLVVAASCEDPSADLDARSEPGQLGVPTLDAGADAAPEARDGRVVTPSDAHVAQPADAAGPPVDAAGAAPAGSCATGTYALCEDFESAAVGGLPSGWTIAAGWNDGAPAVTDVEHHGGTRSLKGAVALNGQPRASRSLASLGAVAGKHWGRIFYKVKAPAPLPAVGAVIHNTLVGLKGASESRVVDTVVNSQGKHQFLYNLPDDSCCTGSAYDYASYDGAWHCAEWYVDEATQRYRFFFEGAEVSAIGFQYGTQQRARIGAYASILLGWINYQMPMKAYEAWFDDLAIDEERIGCDLASR